MKSKSRTKEQTSFIGQIKKKKARSRDPDASIFIFQKYF